MPASGPGGDRGGKTLHRASVASRIVAAVGGGYLLSSLCTVVLSHVLPMATPDAVLSATMLSFLVYAAVVVWVFAAASATRAWAGLVACATPLAAAVLVT